MLFKKVLIKLYLRKMKQTDVIYTYLIVGDILRLKADVESKEAISNLEN